jgi:hypothetical protein
VTIWTNVARFHVCRANATTDQIGYTKGDVGRASLFGQAVNLFRGQPRERVLITGVHKVADLYCMGCTGKVGWVYLEGKPARVDVPSTQTS